MGEVLSLCKSVNEPSKFKEIEKQLISVADLQRFKYLYLCEIGFKEDQAIELSKNLFGDSYD